ncbi:hypothetical protein [Pseudocnuella soli]|uniref:hypothetical protein n=1 Tax=Pseudocnuella soli TaxID=2502779 RepID=UPI00104BB184|nr:hypothetical protein [Pseudocnuella soli]
MGNGPEDSYLEIRYRLVTVDDNYADIKPTHIVNVGAEPARQTIMEVPNPPVGSQINRVYHGWSKLTRQYDKLVSFTGNGGGSEIKVSRISGYLTIENQQITTTTDDRISISYTRKEIKKKRWKRVYGVWDPEWPTANLEQVYAAWEDDTEGTKSLTGSLSTTIKAKLADGTEVSRTGTVGFTVSVKTQDDIITQRKISRNAYFRDAKNDQAWGFQMCDDKGCRYDDTFLTSGSYWPKYDEGTSWSYTWSYKTF